MGKGRDLVDSRVRHVIIDNQCVSTAYQYAMQGIRALVYLLITIVTIVTI